MCVRVSQRQRGRSAGRLLGWAAPVPREGPKAHTARGGGGQHTRSADPARPRPRSRGEPLTATQPLAVPLCRCPSLSGGNTPLPALRPQLYLFFSSGAGRRCAEGCAACAVLLPPPPPCRGAAGAGAALPAASGKVWQGKLGRAGAKEA